MTPAILVAAISVLAVALLFIATLTRARAYHWRARVMQPIAFAGDVDLSALIRAAALQGTYALASRIAFAAAALVFCVFAGVAVAVHTGAYP